MRINPFYWLRIIVGELVMRTTGTWIGSHVDDRPPKRLSEAQTSIDFDNPPENPSDLAEWKQ